MLEILLIDKYDIYFHLIDQKGHKDHKVIEKLAFLLCVLCDLSGSIY